MRTIRVGGQSSESLEEAAGLTWRDDFGGDTGSDIVALGGEGRRRGANDESESTSG